MADEKLNTSPEEKAPAKKGKAAEESGARRTGRDGGPPWPPVQGW